MRQITLFTTLPIAALVTLLLTTSVTAAEVTPVFSTDLPNIPGKMGEIFEVSYAPGESSAMHRHDANTFVYVLEGTVVMAVKGGEEQTLTVGDYFYESPGRYPHGIQERQRYRICEGAGVFRKRQGGARVNASGVSANCQASRPHNQSSR